LHDIAITNIVPPLGLRRPHGLGSPQAGKGAMGRPGRADPWRAPGRIGLTLLLMLTSARPPTQA